MLALTRGDKKSYDLKTIPTVYQLLWWASVMARYVHLQNPDTTDT
jgi:hypothetical protein